MDAQPFTYENWSKTVDELFGIGFSESSMYIVDQDTARRLRAEWTLELQRAQHDE